MSSTLSGIFAIVLSFTVLRHSIYFLPRLAMRYCNLFEGRYPILRDTHILIGAHSKLQDWTWMLSIDWTFRTCFFKER